MLSHSFEYSLPLTLLMMCVCVHERGGLLHHQVQEDFPSIQVFVDGLYLEFLVISILWWGLEVWGEGVERLPSGGLQYMLVVVMMFMMS